MSRQAASDPRQQGDSGTVPLGQAVPLRLEMVTRDTDSSRFPCSIHGNECIRFQLRWATPDGTWIFDRIAAQHVRDQQDGTLNKGKVLAAALAGLNPYTLPDFWLDDQTGEWGFDRVKQQVAGKLQPGLQVSAELMRKLSKDGEARLRVARYLPVAGAGYAPVQGAQPDARSMAGTISQDGRWRWSGAAWEPVGADGHAGSQTPPQQQGRLL